MKALPDALFTVPLPGLARSLTPAEGEHIHNYLELLIKWQKTHRLVGSVEPAWMIENLVLASFAFLVPLPPDTREIADVGSGAGVPGIPLAIVRRDLALTLIEARRRRVSFLSTVVRALGLPNVEVVGARVEDFARDRGEQFGAVVMRCADDPSSVTPHALALLRPDGCLVMTSKRAAADHDERVKVPMLTGGLREFRVIRKSGVRRE